MSKDSKGKTIFKDICLICKELKRLTTKKICYKCVKEINSLYKEYNNVHRRYGYVKKKDHPFRAKTNYVPVYRLIYEEYLTRINGIKTYINPNLDIHHKDFNPENNSILNLQVLTHKDHKAYHHKKGKQEILKRRCLACNGSTWKNKTGVYFWNNYEDMGYLCNRCVHFMKRGVLFSKLFL
jgi:hypothetical protein